MLTTLRDHFKLIVFKFLPIIVFRSLPVMHFPGMSLEEQTDFVWFMRLIVCLLRRQEQDGVGFCRLSASFERRIKWLRKE